MAHLSSILLLSAYWNIKRIRFRSRSLIWIGEDARQRELDWRQFNSSQQLEWKLAQDFITAPFVFYSDLIPFPFKWLWLKLSSELSSNVYWKRLLFFFSNGKTTLIPPLMTEIPIKMTGWCHYNNGLFHLYSLKFHIHSTHCIILFNNCIR